MARARVVATTLPVVKHLVIARHGYVSISNAIGRMSMLLLLHPTVRSLQIPLSAARRLMELVQGLVRILAALITLALRVVVDLGSGGAICTQRCREIREIALTIAMADARLVAFIGALLLLELAAQHGLLLLVEVLEVGRLVLVGPDFLLGARGFIYSVITLSERSLEAAYWCLDRSKVRIMVSHLVVVIMDLVAQERVRIHVIIIYRLIFHGFFQLGRHCGQAKLAFRILDA